MRFLLILLPLLALPVFALGQQNDRPGAGGDLLPFKAVEKTLANGLKVIVVPTGFPDLVSLQVVVQTGSRNEIEPGKSGFAHFFEHMMFRGTKNFPPEKYQAVLTRAGARSNAYTTDDYTDYHATFVKEDLETLLRMEADRFQRLSYSLAAFKTEARTILGEYNKNSAEPRRKLDEVQRDHAFTTHPYKHTTMGFLKDIEDMPDQFQYSREFFERWYRPEYTTLIVAGDVQPEAVLALVEKHWGGWARGAYRADIPQEPPPQGPVYAHALWKTPTPTWVSVAFHGPAFSDAEKDYAALDALLDLYFGPTSELYRKLVEKEQIVDVLSAGAPPRVDPALCSIAARLKRPADAVRVRDEILATAARARAEAAPAPRLADAKSNARYGLARRLDNTEAIAGALAQFVSFQRSYDTLNNFHRLYDQLTPADLQATARKYFTSARLAVTTLSSDPLPAGIERPPSVEALEAASAAAPPADIELVLQQTPLPLLNVKLLFDAGAGRDPQGKEGLAALTAAMISDAGSKNLRIDEINQALYPLAASFESQVDKEMTTFTGVAHRETWARFLDIALPMLLDPGFREEDFRRVKDRQLAALKTDLRSNNEEELARQRLESRIFAGTPYGHPVLGTVAGIESITLDDVKNFAREHYTRANLTVGLAGDAPGELTTRLQRELAGLPAGGPTAPMNIVGRRPQGIEVEIVQKPARATAISFGFPIEVTRSHPDYPALSVARAWFGEHRSSMSHLYQRIREQRGFNYGDYAYIEAFPYAAYSFFPPPNVARRAQIFEVWIRPVVPENAHMALRIAVFELKKLVERGLGQEEFERTRDYLTKNVHLLTAKQDDQLGYALDSRWYNVGDYAAYMREKLSRLTLEDVNRAIRKHLSAENLSVVMVAEDATGLRDQLLTGRVAPIKYAGDKPRALLEEDRTIRAVKLDIKAEAVTITPVDDVFGK